VKLKLKSLLLALTIFLSGCHSITVITPPLEKPAPLVIPANLKITHEEWFCLGKVFEDAVQERLRRAEGSAYIKLGRRDNLKSERIKTLEAVIEATHKTVD